MENVHGPWRRDAKLLRRSFLGTIAAAALRGAGGMQGGPNYAATAVRLGTGHGRRRSPAGRARRRPRWGRPTTCPIVVMAGRAVFSVVLGAGVPPTGTAGGGGATGTIVPRVQRHRTVERSSIRVAGLLGLKPGSGRSVPSGRSVERLSGGSRARPARQAPCMARAEVTRGLLSLSFAGRLRNRLTSPLGSRSASANRESPERLAPSGEGRTSGRCAGSEVVRGAIVVQNRCRRCCGARAHDNDHASVGVEGRAVKFVRTQSWAWARGDEQHVARRLRGAARL
jgi:hypothetical protein